MMSTAMHDLCLVHQSNACTRGEGRRHACFRKQQNGSTYDHGVVQNCSASAEASSFCSSHFPDSSTRDLLSGGTAPCVHCQRFAVME